MTLLSEPLTASRPSAILFDFDGTLAPNLDLPDMRRQVIELTRNHWVPDDVWQGRYIVEIIDAASEHLRQQDIQQADLYFQRGHQLITDIELSAARTTRVFGWTRDVLDRIRSQGIRTAIVTRNCEAAVRETFPDLDDYVDLLLARDNVVHLKPDPRHFAVAIERLERSADVTCIVSDGAMDMRTGRLLGLQCIGVLTGSNTSDQLVEAGAHHILPDASALIF